MLRVEDVIGQLAAQVDGLKKQARQAIRYRTVSSQVPQGRSDALSSALDRGANNEVAEAEHAKDVSVRTVADRVGAEAEASKRQALAAAALPACARRRRAHGAACTASISRCRISTAKRPAPRTASPSSIYGSCSSPPIPSASSGLRATRNKRSLRLAAEEETHPAWRRAKRQRRSGIDARWRRPRANSAAPRRFSPNVTTALADLAAQRNRFENAAREQSERDRQDLFARSIAIERELGDAA